jgi:hypothetical protein
MHEIAPDDRLQRVDVIPVEIGQLVAERRRERRFLQIGVSELHRRIAQHRDDTGLW